MPSKGVKRKEHNYAARVRMINRGAKPKTGPGSRRRWEPDEDLLIVTEPFDITQVSLKLDRSVDAIYVRRSKLFRGVV